MLRAAARIAAALFIVLFFAKLTGGIDVRVSTPAETGLVLAPTPHR